MKTKIVAFFLLWSSWTMAAVINVEFKFTPYVGDPAKADQVETVPGKARVFLNNVLIAEQEVNKGAVPVLFEQREIAPAVWVPVQSLGPAVRKGKNRLRFEFEPADTLANYKVQLSWASVNDQAMEQSAEGSITATNQSGEGAENKEGKGKLILEREFVADFAPDQPWHHYPTVTAVSEEDKQRLAALVKERADLFKPNFSGIYKTLETKPGVDLPELRKAKCVEKAYAAGVRIPVPPEGDLEFIVTGNPEIVVQGKSGQLYPFDPKSFDRIKGDEVQMCAGMVLSMVYPPRMVVVRSPAGGWEVVY